MEIRERNAEQDIKIRDKTSIKKKWQPPVKQMVAKRAEEVSQEGTREPAVDQVEQAAVATIGETAKLIAPYRNERQLGSRVSCGEAKTRHSPAKFTVGRANSRGTVVPTRPKRKIRQTTQNTKKAPKGAPVLAQRFADAVAKASSAMSGAIVGMAGGVVLLIVLCAVVIVAAVASSPFGIFFADEPQPGAIPLSEAIAQINAEFEAKLIELQHGDYDNVMIEGEPPDWQEVVAVFVVKVTAGKSAQVVASLSAEQVEELRTVFWDMTEVIQSCDRIEGGNEELQVLRIVIQTKSLSDMQSQYCFGPTEVALLLELIEIQKET